MTSRNGFFVNMTTHLLKTMGYKNVEDLTILTKKLKHLRGTKVWRAGLVLEASPLQK